MRRSARLLNNGESIIKKEIKEENPEGDVAVGKRKRTVVKKEIKKEKDEIIKTEEIKAEEIEDIGDDEKIKKKVKITKTTTQKGSPYPNFSKPTKEECKEVCTALAKLHGMPKRPNFAKVKKEKEEKEEEKKESGAADCGEVPNVIQAVIRTILSQNTTQENGSRAYRSMTAKYGSMNWQAIHLSSTDDLAHSISCGGLGKVKAGFIKGLLKGVFEKYGKFSLDHFHNQSDEEVFSELVKYKGVGPKTASCVLLFCLRRESFAVDTHIFRISKRLNWVPPAATREQTFLHLDERMPTELKYPLHTLLIRHGKACKNCAANGKTRERTNVIQAKDCPIKKYMSKAPKKEDMESEEEDESEKDEKEEKKGKRKEKAKGKGNEKGKRKVNKKEESVQPEYVVEAVSLEVEGTG